MRHPVRICALCGLYAALLSMPHFDSLGQENSTSGGGKPSKITVFGCNIRVSKAAKLASDRPGIVAFVVPEEGDKIAVGTRVVGLRDEVAKANVEITKAIAAVDIEVKYAMKAHEVDKKDLERAVAANKKVPNAVTEMEVEKMRLAQERSRLQIEKAQHDQKINELKWKQAEAEWQTFLVEAPFDGVVTHVWKQKGEAVRQGDPILEVVNTERVKVEGEVEIQHVFAIKPGARVEVQLAIPTGDFPVENQKFEGRIGFVDVQSSPGTDKVRVWAEVENHDNILRGELLATMTIYPNDVVEPARKESARNEATPEKTSALPANP